MAAYAQEASERSSGGGLLRFLFKRKERQDNVKPKPSAPPRKARRQKRIERPAPVPVVEKAENAKRVLIVGDFMAGGLADGLTEAFAKNANVVVKERIDGSSGLVRDDHYDWPARLSDVIGEENPTVVILMIGSNDRQKLLVEGMPEDLLSDGWIKEYERRVTRLATIIREKSLPFIWVGNLPFRSKSMSADMIAFNDIYRRVVTEAGGEYVDVWSGFTDENGAFVSSGPNMNGQAAQLRTGDVNVTPHGQRKLAFYVEKPLNRLLDLGEDEVPGLLDDIVPEGKPAEINRTVPVAIDDLGAGDGSKLLGAVVVPANGQAKTPGERLAREGFAPEAPPGRVDDFRFKRP